jgi:nucleoside-diphosphate-sugar epimerase
MIDKNAEIFICGHRDTVGSACVRKFEKEGYTNLLLRTRAEPDGMYRKLMDSSKARAPGWKPEISPDEGILRTIKEYKIKQSQEVSC